MTCFGSLFSGIECLPSSIQRDNANLIAFGPLVMYLVVDLNVNIRVCLPHVLLFYVSLNQRCIDISVL